MGGGLAFLSKKGFNPSNRAVQRQVWEAEQRSEREGRAAADRADQLRREREDEDLERSRYGAGGRQGSAAGLGFVYGPPPGLPRGGGDGNGDGNGDGGSDAASGNDLTLRQPGDDAAAAAFRALLAPAAGRDGGAAAEAVAAAAGAGPGPGPGPGAVSHSLRGSEYDPAHPAAPPPPSSSSVAADARSALERAAGVRSAPPALSLDEQVARFPALRGAPMVRGVRGTDVSVTFQPLGASIRNVRCLRCGIWGHTRGDRECSAGGWDPFRAGGGPTLADVKAGAPGAAGAGAGAGADGPSPGLGDGGYQPRPPSPGRDRDGGGEDDGGSSGSDSSSSEERRRRRRRRRKKERKHRHRAEKRDRSRDRSRSRSRDRSRSRSRDRSRGRSRSRSRSPDRRKRRRHRHRRDRGRSSGDESFRGSSGEGEGGEGRERRRRDRRGGRPGSGRGCSPRSSRS